MKTYTVALLEGDGIGPEVIHVAVDVLNKCMTLFGFELTFKEALIGGDAIDVTGQPLPYDTIKICREADAVLLGAVGGDKWNSLPSSQRPEQGLLAIRKELGVFANIRPVKITESLVHHSTLKPEVVSGTDLMVVRELTGGIYFGKPSFKNESHAISTMIYSVEEIERIARVAFSYAEKRNQKVTSVDKANVLAVSQLWREVVSELHKTEYPHIHLEHMYIDNATMQLILNPKQFDVILTGNLFGDILSDASAVLGGSLGLLPSASIGLDKGLFEPVHGSAPDIAGKNMANPIAMVLSSAMLLSYLGEEKAANAIELTIEKLLQEGCVTKDLQTDSATSILTTTEFGRLICANLIN